MQTRPYPSKDGRRVWLSRSEQRELLEPIEKPRRRIALQLGLHGLRTEELLQIQPQHVRQLQDSDAHVLTVPDGKTGKRETPISEDLAERISYLKSAAQLHKDDPVIDVSKRSVRNWMADARAALDHPDADKLGMHDLRRSWATDSYYSLAFGGVPIAEQLVLSWGGWAHTSTGRETFRQNYLGPVPDHITAQAFDDLPMV